MCDVKFIPWVCSVNFWIEREALTSPSNFARPSGNSSPQSADNELGSCADSPKIEAEGPGHDCDVVAYSCSNEEPPAKPPVS